MTDLFFGRIIVYIWEQKSHMSKNRIEKNFIPQKNTQSRVLVSKLGLKSHRMVAYDPTKI